MNPPSPTQERILKAAVHLIRQHGLKGATTIAIAKEAGVNEVTIFRHFKNKQGLIKAAFADVSYAPAISKLIREQATGVLIQDLHLFAETYLRLLRENADLILISMKEPELIRSLDSEIASIPLQIKDALMAYFSRMRDEQKIIATDNEAQALSFIWIVFGYFQATVKHGHQVTNMSEEHFLQHSLQVFARGLTP